MPGLALLFVRAAKLLTPVREAAGQNNHGRFVEAMLAFCGLKPGDPWCMAFVSYVGKQLLGEAWLLPVTGSCDVTLEYARAHKLVLPVPVPGCVGLRLKSQSDADHAFIVAGVNADGSVATVEGNTNDGGGRDGDGVLEHTRAGKDDPRQYVWVRALAA
jgi:hypothetical protein